MKTHSQKFLQKRKFFTVLPLLVIPFMTLFFWALGGGQGNRAQAKEIFKGLNMELPNAFFTKEDEDWNKFSLYERAKRDSLKYLQAKKNDPYYEVDYLAKPGDQIGRQEPVKKRVKSGLNTSLDKKNESVDPNEEKVNRKLDQLYRELGESANHPISVKNRPEPQVAINNGHNAQSDIDRLEQMMLMMRGNGAEDPEMRQIEKVLEKILDIQHPERVKEKIMGRNLNPQAESFTVKTMHHEEISSFGNTSSEVNARDHFSFSTGKNAFYGLEEDELEESGAGNAIEAVVHDTQELTRGSTIKMRLLHDIYINGVLIPKGRFIYGTCLINNERLSVSVESIVTENSLLPVSLKVYDLDGLPGIYVPGALANDIAGQTADRTLQDLNFYSFDPSFSAQAANAGVQATKSLLSKKVKEVKVTVKAGYKILLKDANARIHT